ncbi:protein kinase domain-containing protein [Tsukamurella tyrosinosolvens]|uniref:serine/threonine-protein kinase n=1 Tax=Tsukamurella tyrosinosolvens TaxID=57704 RepID=UPI003F49F491
MLQIGDDFAGYRIERLLGAGGMGEVYVARHPRLPRSDALKVLAPQLATDDHYRARFEREADLAAGLAHPAIVTVHDRGEYDGRLWIALAYIEGADVAKISAEQQLSNPAVTQIIATVADALDYAGGRGLVHRDVKPANILVSTDHRVLLTDFGIARMSDDVSSDLTGTGVTVGTLNYASPEQLRGLPVGPRSDQYSLACTAYQLLARTAPYASSNAASVITGHLVEPPPSIRLARPDLTPAVDAVLGRAMAKDPTHRFGSSVEFATALEAALLDDLPPPAVSSAMHAEAHAHPRSAGHGLDPAHLRDPDRTHLRDQDQLQVASGESRPAGRRTPPVVLAAAIVAVLLVVAGGYGGYRWWLSSNQAHLPIQDPTAEAAALPRTSVSPLLASLERKPDGWRWQVATDLTFKAADQKTAVFVRSAEINPQILPVDAATGKALRGPIPYAGGATFQCAVHGSKFACAQSQLVTVLDLVSGVMLRLSEPAGSDIAFLGDILVTYTSHGGGKAAAGYRPDGSVAWRLAGEMVKVYPEAGMAIAITKPSPSDPFAKGETRILAGDGRVLLQRDRTTLETTAISGSAAGLLMKTTRGPFEAVDRNGAVKALPAEWSPADDCWCDGHASPLPVVYRSVGDNILVGTVNPATGNVLWTRSMFAMRNKGRTNDWTVRASGVGTKTVAQFYQPSSEDNQLHPTEMWDAYTAEGGALNVTGDLVGTDGSRGLAAGRRRLAALAPNQLADLWTINPGGTATADGGGVYIDNKRVL